MIMAASSICFGSSASTMSTTSKRPKVAKLSFHFMLGHSLLIFADTASANFLNPLGSRNASGENRLRITYVAISHLLLERFAKPSEGSQLRAEPAALSNTSRLFQVGHSEHHARLLGTFDGCLVAGGNVDLLGGQLPRKAPQHAREVGELDVE